jgi:hypothetical protein
MSVSQQIFWGVDTDAGRGIHAGKERGGAEQKKTFTGQAGMGQVFWVVGGAQRAHTI